MVKEMVNKGEYVTTLSCDTLELIFVTHVLHVTCVKITIQQCLEYLS